MQSLPLLGLGFSLAIAGIGLFALTMRRPKTEATRPAGQPLKKAELRALEAQQTETKKLRIAAAIVVVVGAVLMVLS